MASEVTPEDMERARVFWLEHAEQFNELIFDNVSNAEYGIESRRVAQRNAEGVQALAAEFAAVRSENDRKWENDPMTKEHYGRILSGRTAEVERIVREVCEPQSNPAYGRACDEILRRLAEDEGPGG